MPLSAKSQPIQSAARTLLGRLAGKARPQGVVALSEATEDATVERAQGRARSEIEAIRRELVARREEVEREQGRREAALGAAQSELELATRQAQAGRDTDSLLQRFDPGRRIDELRQALLRDRLDRELRGLVRLTERSEGDHLVYSLDPAVAPEVARLLGQAFVDGPDSWARVAAESLNADLGIQLHQQGMGLEHDVETPLRPDSSLPPELRFGPPEGEGRPWWREHQLPPMERRRPIQALWREVLSTLRTQTFLVASLVGLALSNVKSGTDAAIGRGGIFFGTAFAILPVVILETGRQRRQHVLQQREEVEKQVTAELIAWAEGRVIRGAARLKDDLEWQVRVRARAAFIQWWRETHAARLPAAIERKREREGALIAKKDELRALQSEQRGVFESIDALSVLLRPRAIDGD